MTGGFVICSYDKVKENFPEFNITMTALRDSLIAKAEADWAPQTYAGRTKAAFTSLGVMPGPGLDVKSGQFGETTITPALFANMSGVRLTTWEQRLTATGSQTIMTGAGASSIIDEDFKVGMAGIAFLDKTERISEIKMQISDKKIPRINIEEAWAYKQAALIFEEGFILDEETGFTLYAYVVSQGFSRIGLIGLQLNRVYDKMLTSTGAAVAAT